MIFTVKVPAQLYMYITVKVPAQLYMYITVKVPAQLYMYITVKVPAQLYMYISPRTGHEDPEGVDKQNETISLTSALGGVGGQRVASAALPRERPGTLCTGGWVGPSAGLDGYRKSRSCRHSISEPSSS